MTTQRQQRSDSNGSSGGGFGDVDDSSTFPTNLKTPHPQQIIMNRSFASYDWLNGVIYNNESIPVSLERKLRALIVDENDKSIILDKFIQEPQIRNLNVNSNDSDQVEEQNGLRRRRQEGPCIAQIKLEGNAWPADQYVDFAYASS